MLEKKSLVVLTLVVGLVTQFAGLSAWGEPSDLVPDEHSLVDDVVEDKTFIKIALTTLEITPTVGVNAALVGPTEEYFYAFHHSMSPRIGYQGAQAAGVTTSTYFFGINYLFDWREEIWEAGADAISDGTGTFTLARRWIFSPHAKFRPYLKAGAGLHIVPNEGLGTFLKVANYQARAAAGIEQLFKPPASLRGELEMVAGANGFAVILAVGYSWAW